jgi:hypothetical protein
VINPFNLIFGCLLLLVLAPVALFLVTFIYRWSCALCGLPRPTMLVAAGIMFVGWLSLAMAVGLLELLVSEACDAARVPRWESGIVLFILALPVDLTVSAGIESGLMGVRFGKGVELWYTQRLIQLSILAAVGFLAGLVVLVRQLS